MGGTLASIIVFGEDTVPGRGGYIGALLGPEGTRECLFSDDDLRKRVACGPASVGVVVCCLRTAQWTRASLL